MRIALLHPTYWPEVRRGSERLLHDYARGLAGRGHDVTIITAHRAAPTRTVEEGVEVIRDRRLPRPRPLRWYEAFIENAPLGAYRVARGGFDVAHALYPSEGAAAILAQRFGGPPLVFSLHGIPVRTWLVEARYRVELLEAINRRSAAVTVLSEAAAEAYRLYLGHDPEVLYPGVDLGAFGSETGRERDSDAIVCAASLTDPRKRGDLLLEAFTILRRERPGARLRLVRTPDPMTSGSEPAALPEGAEWIEARGTRELAAAYASAGASVLPSVGEAFGLVLVEALAAGTPIVTTRSGAGEEVAGDPAIGRLAEPDDPASLAAALGEALDLGDDPGTAEACRRSAARFGLDRALDRLEGLYEDAAGG